MQETTDISIILTFHSEGIIAHRTIQNIFDSTKKLDEEHISYEIIFHVDNGSKDTLEYFSRYKYDQLVKLYFNNFGNPSDSRNFAVKQASGRYVALLDGDDIVSTNWIIDGYHMLEQEDKPVVLHVENNVDFGESVTKPRLWRMSDSFSLDKDLLILFTRNRWCSGTIAAKEVYEKYPYKKASNGFGYEDWTFNIDTRNGGIEHRVVPNSILFYRIKANGIFSSHNGDNAIIDYTKAFTFKRMREIYKNNPEIAEYEAPVPVTKLSIPRRVIRKTYEVMDVFTFTRNIKEKRLYKLNGGQPLGDISYVKEQWRELNKYDGAIYPTKQKLHNLSAYSSEKYFLGLIFCKLVNQVRAKLDYIFVPPQLNVGGTEKVIVNYVKAFAELHPDWHIAVLSSIPERFPYKYPDNVDFIDFYGFCGGLSEYDMDTILSRFIIQSKAKRIHIIHNDFAFRWLERHSDFIKSENYKVHLSQFMYEYTPDSSLKVGYIDPYISNVYPLLTGIYTDNETLAKDLIEEKAFSPEVVKVHYQPIELPKKMAEKTDFGQGDKIKILWASRVSLQKRPDLLKAIATELNGAKFEIDVYGRTQAPYTAKFFDGCKCINYKGYYNGIDSLNLNQYDFFLYTSQTDGMPNILLEIASRGLPIIASNAGGVKDIVKDRETGLLVDIEDVDGYVSAIEYMASHVDEAQKYAKAAKDNVLKEHTWKKFLNAVKRDIE